MRRLALDFNLVEDGLCSNPSHRFIASLDVESNKPADLCVRQDSPLHQIVDVADTAFEVFGDFRFTDPGHAGRFFYELIIHIILVWRVSPSMRPARPEAAAFALRQSSVTVRVWAAD